MFLYNAVSLLTSICYQHRFDKTDFTREYCSEPYFLSWMLSWGNTHRSSDRGDAPQAASAEWENLTPVPDWLLAFHSVYGFLTAFNCVWVGRNPSWRVSFSWVHCVQLSMNLRMQYAVGRRSSMANSPLGIHDFPDEPLPPRVPCFLHAYSIGVRVILAGWLRLLVSDDGRLPCGALNLDSAKDFPLQKHASETAAHADGDASSINAETAFVSKNRRPTLPWGPLVPVSAINENLLRRWRTRVHSRY